MIDEAAPQADAAAVSSPERQRYDQMAKAASAGLMAHDHVEGAIVEISHQGQELVFHLHCTLTSERDPLEVMLLVTEGVVPNIERMLGTTFAARDISFTTAGATPDLQTLN